MKEMIILFVVVLMISVGLLSFVVDKAESFDRVSVPAELSVYRGVGWVVISKDDVLINQAVVHHDSLGEKTLVCSDLVFSKIAVGDTL